MRILSHKVHRHSRMGLPGTIHDGGSYKPSFEKRGLRKQSEEIQNRLTSKLENEVEDEPGDLSNFKTI